jgi:pimeloyl-ACP methyl ester carboxylesterase
MGPFRRLHCRGEIISYPVSTTSLVRHRAGVGEPLVLLHGVGESAVGWRPVQQALSRAYDVIALDFPGFGGSARLSANALSSAVALADAVEREMDQLGIGDFHVAGYSLGARVSLELATRGRTGSAWPVSPGCCPG